METKNQTTTPDTQKNAGNLNVEKTGMGAGEGLNPSIKTRLEAERIKKILANANIPELNAKYAAAVIIAEVKNKHAVYGEGAVAKLDEVLKIGKTWLYGSAKVAEVWSQTEFDGLVQRAQKADGLLSWSHLVEIAALESPTARDHMLKEVLERGMSVDELQTNVKDAKRARSSGKSKTKASTAAGSGKVTTVTKLLAGTVKSLAKSKPENASRAALEAMVRQCQAAEETAKLVRERFEKAIAEMDKKTANLATAPVVKDSTRKVEPGASAAQQ